MNPYAHRLQFVLLYPHKQFAGIDFADAVDEFVLHCPVIVNVKFVLIHDVHTLF